MAENEDELVDYDEEEVRLIVDGQHWVVICCCCSKKHYFTFLDMPEL